MKTCTANASRICRRAAPTFPNRETFPILHHGNMRFAENVRRVLDEARRYHPGAYADALQHFAKAEWVPDHPRFQGTNYIAFSDGIFRCDGSEWYGYEGFRKHFWHEVGHAVDAESSGSPDGQARADNYAADAVAQIERAKRQQHARPLTPIAPGLTPAPRRAMREPSLGRRAVPALSVSDPSRWSKAGAGLV